MSKQVGKAFEVRVKERIESYEYGADLVPFSGAGKEKGDITASIGDHNFMIECKKTRNRETWTLERYVLEKIEEQAASENRLPLLTFSFQRSKIYAILPLDNFLVHSTPNQPKPILCPFCQSSNVKKVGHTPFPVPLLECSICGKIWSE